MNEQTRTNISAQAITGGLALGCLLIYTWRHTAGLLAQYVEPPAIGFLAATGIELAVVWLSIRIGQARNHGRQARGLSAVLFGVAGVSVLANVANGYETAFGVAFTGAHVRSVDWLQAFIGVVATALIPLLVFAIANVIGSDVRAAERKATAAERKANASSAPNAEPLSLNTAAVRPEQTPEQQFIELVTADPAVSYRALAETLGRSVSTVKPLADRAGWRKNGHGWEAVDAQEPTA